jgi:N-acetylmuramoyl-L-alanine amidase
MSNYKWLIDEGHGGINPADGSYMTPEEKSKQYRFTQDGFQIYEGLTNRLIGKKLKELLSGGSIEWEAINHPIFDTSLQERVRIADELFREDKRCIFVSIHSDKISADIEGEGNKASKCSIWTSKGQTKSDKIADIFITTYEKHFPGQVRKDQSDEDGDMEADYYVLRKTDCPAILVENFFYDNRKDAEFLMSEVGQTKIAEALFESIKNCDWFKPVRIYESKA